MTVMDYQCPECSHIWEVTRGMKDESPILCPSCSHIGLAYFGKMNASDVQLSFGFRPEKYDNDVDRRIAQFQHTHL
jgi:putative FmdB family regulatory protein